MRNYLGIATAGGVAASLLILSMLIPVTSRAAGGAGCIPNPSGVVSWWRAESNAVDVVAGNNGVLLNGAGFAPGQVGLAFRFDGSNALVKVPDAVNLRFTNAMTVEGWVFPTAYNSVANEILSKWDAPSDDQRAYTFKCDPTGHLILHLSADGGSSFVTFVASSNSLPLNQWSHVAGTYDGAALKVFLNGNLQASGAWTSGIFPGHADLGIGSPLIASAPFSGRIDEITLYNRALSQSELQGIYFNGTTGKCTTATGPVIVSQPTNQTIGVGGSAGFSVTATGTAPLNYQWRYNGTNLTGATSTFLTLSNVQPSQAGNYAVQVTNIAGLALSSNALLSVTSIAPTCVSVPSGLVSWWPGESNANDVLDGNSGVLLNGTGFASGKVGRAFDFDGVNDSVQVGDAPNLRFTNAMTVEAWVFPRVEGVHSREVVSKIEGGVDQRSYTLSINADPAALGKAYFLVSADGGFGQLGIVQSASVLPTNQWTHLAATYDGISLRMYVNGVLENTLPWTNGIFGGSAPLVIGSTLGSGSYFDGLIDELSLYRRPLAATEIQGIYNAGSAGKCLALTGPSITTQPANLTLPVGSLASFSVTATGTAPLSYQWRYGGTNVVGATNTSLTLSNVQLAQAGNYAVLVTNIAGSALSSNALLTVTSAPSSCVTPPSGLVSWWRAESNANDSVDGNSGSLNGVTFAAGEVGEAFSFNGTSAFVQVSDAADLRFTNAMTFEAWVYPRAVGGAYHEIMSKWEGGVNQRSYLVAIDPDGRVEFTVNSDGVNNLAGAFSLTGVGTNTWIHVAGVYDGVSVRLYLNGVLQGNTSWTQGIFPGSAPLIIGSTLLSGSFFNGLIDEASIYNRALTATEVAAIYGVGAAGKCGTSITPFIVTQPQNQTIVAGSNVAFTVTANGSAPLRYQWKFGGTNIVGATNASLVLSNVQVVQAGNYSVQISNSLNTALSSNALLTVISTSGNCVTLSNLVSWWRAEGNASDSVDGNSGAFIGGATTTNGLVGRAFNFNGTSAFVQVADAAVLRLTNAMTFEAWVYPRTVGGAYHEIMSKWEGGFNQRSYLAAIDPDGRVEFTVNSDGDSSLAGAFSVTAVPANQWVHLAGVYDGVSVKLYLNGVLQNSTPWTQGIFPGSAPLIIGSTLSSGSFFDGLIDESSLYNRALSVTEIQGIVNAGSSGKCVVSNAAPVIVTQPTNQTIAVGGSASFNVNATGTAPLRYQWRFNSTNVAGATNASLTLSNVQPSQAGNYALLVTNVAGSAISSNALLTVTSAPSSCITPPSGLVSWWRAESNANDSVDGNTGFLSNGVNFVSGEVGQAFNFNGTTGFIRVPGSAALNVGTSSNGLTLEGWIKPADLVAPRPLADWNNGTNFGAHFWVNEPWFGGQGGPGDLFANLIDTSGGTHALVSAPGVLNSNSWQHVAVTYDKASGLGVLYVNGAVVYSTGLGNFTPQTSYDLYLGRRPAPDIITNYSGLMDEMSLYSRALSQSEIQAIVTADGNGKCAVAQSNCVPAASGLVSLWRAENNANDSADSNTGYPSNGVSFAAGKIGQAFNFNSTGSMVRVPASANLNVGTSNGFTIETWINPADVSIGHPIFEWNSGSYGVCLWVANWGSSSVPGSLYGDVKDDGLNDHAFQSAGGLLTSNVFQHVALTYDKTAGTAALYINGLVVTQKNLGTFTPLTSADAYIGYRPFDGGAGSRFVGLIDEVSLYNRALTTTEIQAIYSAGGTGKCPPNHPPLALNINTGTKQNLPMAIPADKFLALASDPDNDALTLSGVSAASTNGGGVTLASNQVIYTPALNFIGADRFTYSVSDGRGGTNSAFVLVQVRSANLISGNMLPPAVVSNGFQVSFVGIPGRTYSLQRATNVAGPWTNIGAVLAGTNGLGVFTDTNPPPASAFYRTTYP